MDGDGNRNSYVRLVVRHTSALVVTQGARSRAMLGTSPLEDLIFHNVLGASLAHLPHRHPVSNAWIEIDQSSSLGRPVNAATIARSMRLPKTNARRRLAALVTAGLLVRGPDGFRVAPRANAAGELSRLFAAQAMQFNAALGALALAGYPPAIDALAAGVAALPAGVVRRFLLIFELRSLELTADQHGDLAGSSIVAAVVSANVSHITAHPSLARQYSALDAIPPDEERRPVTLRDVARALHYPFETVRRRALALTAQGVMVRQTKGYIVPTKVLASASYEASNLRAIGYFEQTLATLTALARETGAPAE